jgi:hypothetical protein
VGDRARHDLSGIRDAPTDALDEAAQLDEQPFAQLLAISLGARPWTGKPRITAVFTIVRRWLGTAGSRSSCGARSAVRLTVHSAIET